MLRSLLFSIVDSPVETKYSEVSLVLGKQSTVRQKCEKGFPYWRRFKVFFFKKNGMSWTLPKGKHCGEGIPSRK